jgi:ABC-type lipoprotein release transport system permease subunit
LTVVLLGVIGLAAGYFPSLRAASVQPADTLRYE